MLSIYSSLHIVGKQKDLFLLIWINDHWEDDDSSFCQQVSLGPGNDKIPRQPPKPVVHDKNVPPLGTGNANPRAYSTWGTREPKWALWILRVIICVNIPASIPWFLDPPSLLTSKTRLNNTYKFLCASTLFSVMASQTSRATSLSRCHNCVFTKVFNILSSQLPFFLDFYPAGRPLTSTQKSIYVFSPQPISPLTQRVTRFSYLTSIHW